MKSPSCLQNNLRWMMIGTALVLAANATVNAQTAIAPQKGISLQSTRLIYPEDMLKGITFTVTNHSLTPYLIQSRISTRIPGAPHQNDDEHSHRAMPFIVLPPLKKLVSDEQLTLVIRLTKNSLPKDRESVFAFHVKAIPSQPANNTSPVESLPAGTVKVTLALQNTLKLFYRPNGMVRYDVKKIADSLRFYRKGEELIVDNPGPFYVTFHSLSVGLTAIDPNALFQMVPPYGQQSYPLPLSGSGDIRWKLVNDYGQATDAYTRQLIQ